MKLQEHQSVADLPPPQESNIYSYQEVHHSKRGGTYLADMFERHVYLLNIASFIHLIY